MNPLTSLKCAGRLFMALAAVSGIFLTAGCGTSGSTAPNNNGFSNSSLTGTYVISISGTDVNSAGNEVFFAIAGSVTADGNGNITGGTVDINDANLPSPGVFPGQALTASKYSITSDGRGTGTLITPQGTFGLDFILTSSSHGLISRFDGNGTGSGTLDTQGSATQSSLGSLAFSLSGAAGANPFGTVGGFTLNPTTGAITTGVQDFNEKGSSISGPGGAVLTGSLVVNSGTGTAQFNSSFGSLLFDVWVIDSTHLKLIETDTSGIALSGDAFTQQTSFTAGELAFTLAGADNNADPVAAGGLVSTDVNGNLGIGGEDYNNAGSANSVSFTGSCTTFTAGRCQLSLPGFTNGAVGNLTFASYPSSGGVLMLEDDGSGILQGTAFAQGATAFTAPGAYGLNLSGENTDGQEDVGEVDNIAQFNATTATTNNITCKLDENSILGGELSTNLTGATYTPDSPATGRGSITVPNIGTFTGTLNLEYYVVDASTVVFIEVDADQVSVGTFEAQTTSGSGAIAQSHMSIMRPVFRPHAAFRKK
ncbi:MAG: hypothetical protein WBE52_06370 [Terriglobales bacterium]